MNPFKTIINSILILSITFSNFQARADNSESQERQKAISEICLSSGEALHEGPQVPQKNGKLLRTFYMKVAADADQPAKILDCTSVFKTASQSKLCPLTDPKHEKLVELAKTMQYQIDLADCSKKGTPKLSSACVKEIGCNGMRSIVNMSTFGLFAVGGKLLNTFNHTSPSNSCMGIGQDDCLTKAMEGVLKDLWGQITGIAELPGMIWKAGKWVVNKIGDGARACWDLVTGTQSIQDKITEKLMAARTVTSSLLSQFIKNPQKFITDMMTKFYNTVLEAITPIAQKANLSIACSTCDGIMNGVCEIAGYLGGEVLTAFFTGGLANVSSKVAKIPRIASALEKMNDAAKVVVKAGSEYKAINAGFKIIKAGGKAVVAVGAKTISLLSKVPGAKPFLSLSEDAFMKGYLSEKAFVEWKNTEKTLKAFSALEEMRGVGKSKGVVSTYERALIGEHPEVNWGKLSKSEFEKKLQELSGANDAVADVIEAKDKSLIKDQNARYINQELSPDGRTELGRLQKEIHFDKLSADRQADFMNRFGDTHFSGRVEVSRKGLTDEQFNTINKMSPDEKIQLARDGKIALKPDAEKVAALKDFRDYLTKEYKIDGSKAVSRLADQKVLALGSLESRGIGQEVIVARSDGSKNVATVEDAFTDANGVLNSRVTWKDAAGNTYKKTVESSTLISRETEVIFPRSSGGESHGVVNQFSADHAKARILWIENGRPMEKWVKVSDLKAVPELPILDPLAIQSPLTLSNDPHLNQAIQHGFDHQTKYISYEDEITGKRYPAEVAGTLESGQLQINRLTTDAQGKLIKVPGQILKASELKTARLSTSSQNQFLEFEKIHVPSQPASSASVFSSGVDPQIVASLKSAGVDKAIETIRVDGGKITILQPHDIGSRMSGWMVVETSQGKFVRPFYQSNSQGVFRFMDGYGEVREGWYGKHHIENAMNLPPEVQKFLSNYQSTHPNLPKLNHDLLEKINPHIRDRGEFRTNEAGQSGEKIKVLRDETIDSHGNVDPKNVVLKPEKKPDFGHMVDSYQVQTSLYGKVDAQIYHSADGTINYTIYKDAKGRVFFAGATGRAGINQFGVSSRIVDMGLLDAPLMEYKAQVNYNYINKSSAETNGSYISNWGYVKNIPEIKEYYRVKGLKIPE